MRLRKPESCEAYRAQRPVHARSLFLEHVERIERPSEPSKTKTRLIQANLRLVASVAKHYLGRGLHFWISFKKGTSPDEGR